MELYLALNTRQLNQYDYGLTISGSVWENREKTVPHDLRNYDRIRYRHLDRDTHVPQVEDDAEVVDNDPGNLWRYKIGRNALLREGIFQADILCEAADLAISTIDEQVIVLRNGARP